MKASQFKVGYGAEFRAQHEAQQRQLEQDAEAQRADNERARKEYLSRLAAQQEAKRQEFEDAIDERLAADKQRLQREWLVNNPGQDSRDFDRHVWRHRRVDLREELLRADQAATRSQLMNSGIYADGF